MDREQFITQLDKLLPNKFGLQLKIFSMAQDYAQQQLLNFCKPGVSGWQDFDELKLQVNDLLLAEDMRDETVVAFRYTGHDLMPKHDKKYWRMYVLPGQLPHVQKLINKALHSLLPRAEGLLSGLLMGLDMEIDWNKKGVIKTVAEAKALITEAELLLNQQPGNDFPTQFNKGCVSGRSEPQLHTMAENTTKVEGTSESQHKAACSDAAERQ